jgi:F-type H+-transporting ATPase subunit epsilon
MRLLVTTPMAVVVDLQDLRHVRAEDETGAFGILRHHADFLTVLAVSVISWRDAEGREAHVAVRGGVLAVRGGDVSVATHEAVTSDSLEHLESAVLQRFREDFAADELARSATARLETAVVRQICRYLRPQPGSGPGRLAGAGTPSEVPE